MFPVSICDDPMWSLLWHIEREKQKAKQNYCFTLSLSEISKPLLLFFLIYCFYPGTTYITKFTAWTILGVSQWEEMFVHHRAIISTVHLQNIHIILSRKSLPIKWEFPILSHRPPGSMLLLSHWLWLLKVHCRSGIIPSALFSLSVTVPGQGWGAGNRWHKKLGSWEIIIDNWI